MRIPRLRLERIPAPSRARTAVVFAVALAVALLLGAAIFGLYGLSPVQAGGLVVEQVLGSRMGWAEAVRRATPLLLIGGGMVVAACAQFWNIGADGQVLSGAAAAAGLALFSGLSGPWLLPAMFVGGAIAGGLWALIPCLLRARFGVNEIITGLMMNYVALNGVDYLIQGPWRGRTTMGYAYTDRFPDAAAIPVLPGTHVHWPTALCGLLLVLVLHFVLFRTRLGFRVRVIGENPSAARYAGISSFRCFLWVAMIAGGAAGLAGVGEVAGIHHRLLAPNQITINYGFNAVIVALLARGEPLRVIPTALLLGLVLSSSTVITVFMRLPVAVTSIFTGLMLYFLSGGDLLLQYRLRRRERRVPCPA
jgi:general nucleoside transport system permease protein